MLEEVLRYINNRFDTVGGKTVAVSGRYEVSGGTVQLDFLADGQYYWIEGSRLNDGLHLYPSDDLRDETFDGRVIPLYVPRAVESIASEIAEWTEANSRVLSSPYQSESFGGYSYSKASGGAQGNEVPSAAWQLQFGARLRPWRKISRDWI